MYVQMRVICPKLNIKLKFSLVLILLSGTCNSDVDHIWTPFLGSIPPSLQIAAVAALKYSFPLCFYYLCALVSCIMDMFA